MGERRRVRPCGLMADVDSDPYPVRDRILSRGAGGAGDGRWSPVLVRVGLGGRVRSGRGVWRACEDRGAAVGDRILSGMEESYSAGWGLGVDAHAPAAYGHMMVPPAQDGEERGL